MKEEFWVKIIRISERAYPRAHVALGTRPTFVACMGILRGGNALLALVKGSYQSFEDLRLSPNLFHLISPLFKREQVSMAGLCVEKQKAE